MSAARIASDGKVTRLGSRAGAPDVTTEDDVKDPAMLAKLLGRMRADLADLKRRYEPRRLDFEDQPMLSGVGNTISLAHGFGGRVRFWLLDSTSQGGAWLNAATTKDTLVLDVAGTSDGTCTVRVEEAG